MQQVWGRRSCCAAASSQGKLCANKMKSCRCIILSCRGPFPESSLPLADMGSTQSHHPQHARLARCSTMLTHTRSPHCNQPAHPHSIMCQSSLHRWLQPLLQLQRQKMQMQTTIVAASATDNAEADDAGADAEAGSTWASVTNGIMLSAGREAACCFLYSCTAGQSVGIVRGSSGTVMVKPYLIPFSCMPQASWVREMTTVCQQAGTCWGRLPRCQLSCCSATCTTAPS